MVYKLKATVCSGIRSPVPGKGSRNQNPQSIYPEPGDWECSLFPRPRHSHKERIVCPI